MRLAIALPPTNAQAASSMGLPLRVPLMLSDAITPHLRYWLLAAGIITLAVFGVIVYLTRLNLRMEQRGPGRGALRGCVPQIVRQMQAAARAAAVIAIVLPAVVLIGWTLRIPILM